MSKFAICALSLFIAACNPTPPGVPENAASRNAAQETKMDHQAFVTKYFDTFNKHDWTALSQMYAENAQFKDPSLGPNVVTQSRDAFVKKYTELSETFSDVKDEVVSIYPSGDNHVVVEFVSSGTAPDGSKFELPICTIFTIENGLITKDYTYYDNFEEQQ